MVQLKGISWDHPRGYDPMVATAKAFKDKYPEIEIIWEKDLCKLLLTVLLKIWPSITI